MKHIVELFKMIIGVSLVFAIAFAILPYFEMMELPENPFTVELISKDYDPNINCQKLNRC